MHAVARGREGERGIVKGVGGGGRAKVRGSEGVREQESESERAWGGGGGGADCDRVGEGEGEGEGKGEGEGRGRETEREGGRGGGRGGGGGGGCRERDSRPDGYWGWADPTYTNKVINKLFISAIYKLFISSYPHPHTHQRRPLRRVLGIYTYYSDMHA